MNPAARAFAADTTRATWVVASLFAAVLGLFQLAELAGAPLPWTERLRAAVAVLPAWVVAVSPVCAAAGAGWTRAAWRRDGRLVACAASGVGPARLAGAAVVGAAVAVGMLVGVREAVAPWGAATRVQHGAWALLDAPTPSGADQGWFGADVLLTDGAEGVRVAWLRDGVVVGGLRAPSAVWSDGWVVGGDGVVWGEGGAVDVPALLPDPETWRRASAVPSWQSAPTELLGAPASPARATWLAERVATPVLAVLLAGLAVLVPPTWAVGGAVVLRLVAAALLASAARGELGVTAAAAAPVVIVAVAVVASARISSRLPAYSATIQ